MLAEVIGAEKLFGLVAFTEFMYVGEVGDTVAPVRLGIGCEFLTTVTTDIGSSDRIRWWSLIRKLLRRDVGCRVEDTLILAGQCDA